MVQMKGGLSLNDDAGLETEADVMGTKANKVSDAHLDKRSSAFILGNKKNLSIQLASYYHGGARKFVESAVKESHNAKKNTEGELGTGGMYYWKDDEDAAIISAFTYTNKGEEWSVMRIEISGKISEILLNAKFKVLVFRNSKDSPMSPGMDEDGKVVEEKYPGINYKMLQEYKKRKLSEITENDKRILEVKGENQHYKNCTGRQFMDKFDFIQAPTSGNYDLTELKQVKVNDEVLKKLIYPKKDKSNDFENQMAIIWEGQIDADKTDSVKRTYKLGSKNVGEELLIKSKDLNSGIKIKKISQKK